MKILVTGVHGTIGSYIYAKLQSDDKITAYASGRRPDNSIVNYLQFDLENILPTNSLPDGIDYVIHCAGIGLLKMWQKPNHNANEKMIENLLVLLQKSSFTGKIIYLSTIKVHENQLLVADPYIKSKKRCEQILLESSFSKNVLLLRLPIVLDPGDKQIQHLFRVLNYRVLPIIKNHEALSSFINLYSIFKYVSEYINGHRNIRNNRVCIEADTLISWNSLVTTYHEVNKKYRFYIKVSCKSLLTIFRWVSKFNRRRLIFGQIPLPRIYDIFYYSWRYQNQATVDYIQYHVDLKALLCQFD